MAAAKQTGRALELASEDLNIDRDILMDAVNNNGLALRRVSNDI